MRWLVPALTILAACALAQVPAATPATAKRVPDALEYELVQSLNTADPVDQLAALDRWTAAYPATQFLEERQNLYLNTYVVLKQPRQAFDTAQEILKTRPNDLAALMQTVDQVMELGPDLAAADLQAAERAALRLTGSPALKPPEFTDEQWEPVNAYSQKVLAFVRSATAPAGSRTPSPQVKASTPLPRLDVPYTDEARLAGLEGTVNVAGAIGADGKLHDSRVAIPLGLGLDEQALAWAAQLQFAPSQSPDAVPQALAFPVDFTLPEKHSRWHLVAVNFKTPQGASRPTFSAADYPLGPGISLAAYEEAEIMSVIGRAASATVSFEIDPQGYPRNFIVESASAEPWEPEAVALIAPWRFHPGMKAGAPISVPCTVSLVWGPEDFTSPAIAEQLTHMANSDMTATRQAQPLPGPPAISKKEPEYTEEARLAGREGTVWISAVVDPHGEPTAMRLDGPFFDAGLEQNALEAVRQWRFQPTQLNGRAMNVQIEVRIDFKLSGAESSVFIRPPTAVKPVAKTREANKTGPGDPVR